MTLATGSQRRALTIAGVSRSTWHYRSRPRPAVLDPLPQKDRAYPSRISADRSHGDHREDQRRLAGRPFGGSLLRLLLGRRNDARLAALLVADRDDDRRSKCAPGRAESAVGQHDAPNHAGAQSYWARLKCGVGISPICAARGVVSRTRPTRSSTSTPARSSVGASRNANATSSPSTCSKTPSFATALPAVVHADSGPAMRSTVADLVREASRTGRAATGTGAATIGNTGGVGYDVVVIGAGFAGLAAARELAKDGFDVVVLEGRDRVGGRSSTTTLAGVPVDLGGTFVGPTQDAVLALAKELDCPTEPDLLRGRQPHPLARQGAVLPRHDPQAVAARAARHRPASNGRSSGSAADVDITKPWAAPRRQEARRHVAGRLVALGGRQRLLAGPVGDHGAGDLGRRARRRVDAARGPLRQGRRRSGPHARRGRRCPAGPLPRRHPTDRRQDGRRAG